MPVPVANADPFSGKRAVSIKIVAPGQVWAGRLENPDPVLRQFSYEGIVLYERMFRQFPMLAGVCHLAADRVCAIDRTIKAGDENDGQSREMRDKTISLYRRIPDLHIINKKQALGRYFGFAATGKADWQIDEETGLNAPTDLYDIPQRYLHFDPTGTAYMRTATNWNGVPINPDDLFFYRWGSRWSPYGEADLQDVYLATWYLQQVRQFGMAALELLGRPIPWIEVPSTLSPEELATLEAGWAKQYKYYVVTMTNSGRTSVTFPAMNVLANGAAGKSELEYKRDLYGEIYVRLLGVQLTQDTSGGSRALETARMDVISDKTPPASQALDQAWTRGWSDHIWRVNAPSAKKQIYPRFESDTSKAGLDGRQLQTVIDVGTKLATKQITATFAQRVLEAAGIPSDWARDMVNSTTSAKDLAEPPAPPQLGQPTNAPTAPPAQGDQNNEAAA